MRSHLETEELLIRRLLPASNPCEQERAYAWEDWQETGGAVSLRRFIQMQNNTTEADEDIFQETVATAYQEVERGRYQPQLGVPFTAYVKGIARNKIREARRRTQRWGTVPLEMVEFSLADAPFKQPEAAFERRQERAYFYQGLSALPAGRKQVLERVARGEGTAEIAHAMQISEELVRQHKSRGLRVLREMAMMLESA
ncbi:MAG: hypothetical protein Fur0022_30980 [Anaerolineales bacterium]